MTYTDHADVQAVLFDIDGTLTTGGPVWKALVQSSDVALLRKLWLYGTAFPHYALSKASIADQAGFRDRWVRLMAWLMRGWPRTRVDAMCEEIVQTALVSNMRPDVVDVLDAHRAQGHPVVLVSTMFERIVSRFAEIVHADTGLGSQVAFDGDVCAGRIIGETCSGVRKVAFAQRYLAEKWPDIAVSACAAYADSASDIPFLSGVGYPVAVYPDDAMREAAEAAGWHIFEGR